MKNQSIKKYLSQYRKFYAKREFVPSFIASVILSTTLLLSLLIHESIFYSDPNMKKILINYFFIISLSIVLYPFIVGCFRYYNIFNNSKDTFLASLLAKTAPDIDDKLLNSLELENELHSNQSPSNDLSEKAINNVLKQLENFNYSKINSFNYAKKYNLIALSVIIIFALFNNQLLLSANRLLNVNKTFIKPTPFTLHSISNNLKVLQGDSVSIYISGIGELPDSINIKYKMGQDFKIDRLDLNNELYSYTFFNTQKDIIWQVEKENKSFFSFWNKISSKIDTITVIERPYLTDLKFEIIPPKYTNEKIYTRIGNVSEINILNGSSIIVHSKFNKPINNANLFINGTPNPMNITNLHNAQITFTIEEDAILYITCEDENLIDNKNPINYTFNVIEDEPPLIFINSPSKNFEINESDIIPFNFQINDDYGFNEIWIEYYIHSTISDNNAEKLITKKFINFPDKKMKNQLVSYNWDVSNINIDLDEEIHITINVSDNNVLPSPSITKSDIIIAYYPTIEDLFNSLEDEENIIEEYNEEIMLSIDEVQELVQDMELKLLKANDISWDEEKKMNQILTDMEEIFNQIEDVKETLGKIEDQANKNNLVSDQLIEKFQKFQELLDDIMTDELMSAMEKMQQAMENMDKQEMMDAIENFDYDLEKFEGEIDRFIDMFEQAVAEQQINELIKTIESMIEKQESISNELSNEKIENKLELSNMSRQQEQQLKKLDNLIQNTELAIKDLSEPAAKSISNLNNSDNHENAKKNITKTRKNIQNNNFNDASNNSDKAEKNLNQMLNDAKIAQKQFQDDTLEEMLYDFLSVIKNLLLISNQQEILDIQMDGIRSNNPQLRNLIQIQNSIRQKLIRTIDQLIGLSKKTFYITPKIGKSLGKSKSNMDKSILSFEQKRLTNGRKSQKNILIGINESINLIMDAMEEMNSSLSASGFDSYMKQLEEMSSNQQGINKGTMQLGQMGMMAQQLMMQKLQQQQQSVQKSLEQLLSDMPGNNEHGGLSKSNEDMKEIISDFKRKNITPETIIRQESILSRMLDSQKSLKQKDFSEKRKSAAGNIFEYTGTYNNLENIEDKNLLFIKSMESALEEGHSRNYQDKIKSYFLKLQKDAE